MRFLTVICALCVLAIQAAAQDAVVVVKPLTDSDIQLLRSDVQASKNDIITHTMQFNDTESAAFWPVYRDYARDQQVIGDKRYQLIKSYAQKFDTMDDATASDLAKQQFDIENDTAKLRSDYWPKFAKAIGAKRAAKFYQVDNRLSLMINLELASDIPLIP
jgi:hypothetical protein